MSGNFWADNRDAGGERLTDRFIKTWEAFAIEAAQGGEGEAFAWPSVEVPVPNFIGLRLALQRKRLADAGKWTEAGDPDALRLYSFDPTQKRSSVGWAFDGASIVTRIKPGARSIRSVSHRDFVKAGGDAPFAELRTLLEDQPDPVFVQPPFKA